MIERAPGGPGLTPTPETRPHAWTRIIRITRPIFTSESRWAAISWLSALLVLMLAVTWAELSSH